MWWQTAAVILSLGLDNLVTSTVLGASNVRNKLKLVLVFALFEGGMPAAGFLAGKSVGDAAGAWGFYIGTAAMLALGIYMLFADDDDGKAERLGSGLKGWALVAAGSAVSLDELAAGVGFGLLQFPVLATVSIIAVQALVFSYIGLTFGKRLKPLLGEWAEKAGGIALIAAAALFLAEKWF